MAKRWQDYTPKQKKIYKIVLGSVAGFFVFIMVIAAFAGSGSGEKEKGSPKSSTTFKGTVLNQEVVDPATLRVFYEVENTGDQTGKPTCTINASNETGTYKGYDFFELEELEAKKKEIYKGNLTITKEGASHVTDITVDCK